MKDSDSDSANNVNFEAIYLIRIILSCISAFFSCIVIFSYLKFKSLKKFAFKLICLMSISDLIFAGSALLVTKNAEEGFLCKFQAYLQYASGISTVFWSSIIAYSLFDIVLNQRLREVQKKLNKFLFIGYGFPMILAMIPLILGIYGPQSFLTDEKSAWCGTQRVENHKKMDNYILSLILDICVRFFPVLICFSLNAYFCWKLWRYFREFKESTNLMCTIKKKIILIPLIPLLSWFIEFIFRCEEVFSMVDINEKPGTFQQFLQIFDITLIHVHPIFNSLIYANTSYFKREWTNYFFDCKKKNKLLKKENYSSFGEEVNSIEVENKNSKSTHSHESFGTLNA